MKTLEDILRENFNCEKPFLDEPYYDEDERAPVVFTEEGSEAYSRLIHLVYDIGSLTGTNVNGMVDKLDAVSSEM